MDLIIFWICPISFIITLLVSLIFFRSWGRNKFITLIIGLFLLYTTSLLKNFGELNYFIEAIILIFEISILCFYISVCLVRIENFALVKNPIFIISILFSVCFTIIALIVKKKYIPEYSGFVNMALYFLGVCLICPLYEEILVHEVIFRLINKEYEKRGNLLLNYFFVSLIVLLFHINFFDISVAYIPIFLLFFLLFIIRILLKNNSQFCFLIICHSFYNFIYLMTLRKIA